MATIGEASASNLFDVRAQVVVVTGGVQGLGFTNASISASPGFLDLNGNRIEAGAIENISAALRDRMLSTNLTSIFTTIQAAPTT